MFFLTTALLCVLALPQAITADFTSPTESTVWNSGDQVTVDWDPSQIPAEGDSPGKLVLGHPEGDSDNLDLDHPLAQDFPLSAGSVQFTVPDLSSASNYIVVLLAGDSDDGDASPQFTINGNGQPKLVKKAPQEMPDSDPSDPTDSRTPATPPPDPSGDPSTDSPDTPDTPDSSDPGAGPAPTSSGAPTSPAPAAATATGTGTTTSAAAATTTPSTPKNATSPSSAAPLSAGTSSSLNPSTTGSGSGSNGALSFAHAHHTGAISLSAAVAAMGLVFAF
ncbi:hypothetical protein BC826DRAFT_1032898 [Russula brevipes]|nr:hypothetical protein BC826DRAFT_1032898 [Russula brevipes]